MLWNVLYRYYSVIQRFPSHANFARVLAGVKRTSRESLPASRLSEQAHRRQLLSLGSTSNGQPVSHAAPPTRASHLHLLRLARSHTYHCLGKNVQPRCSLRAEERIHRSANHGRQWSARTENGVSA
nr:hypothetical protein CFP56_07721 [Quercus suber]